MLCTPTAFSPLILFVINAALVIVAANVQTLVGFGTCGNTGSTLTRSVQTRLSTKLIQVLYLAENGLDCAHSDTSNLKVGFHSALNIPHRQSYLLECASN